MHESIASGHSEGQSPEESVTQREDPKIYYLKPLKKSARRGDKSPDYEQRRINPALKPGFQPGAVENSEL
jgi:hypothetical protein